MLWSILKHAKVTPLQLLQKGLSNLSSEEAAYLLYLIRQARTDFSAFCYCVYPNYQFPYHLRRLTQTLTEIEQTPNARTIVTCPPRHGKCVSGSMRVNLSDGRLVPISELVQQNKPVRVKALEIESARIVDSVADDFVYSGEKRVYRVTLFSGRVLECTEEHPLWTVDGWKPLSELQEGDLIGTGTEEWVFTWDAITHIWEKGIEAVYDIRVQDTHNFLVEGIVVHNSLTVSTLFPAYFFGRNPSLNLITASYTAGLTGKFAGEIRQFMSSPIYNMIFPKTIIQGRAMARWGIQHYGGSILATGVTSGMTGFGADCLPGETLVETRKGSIDIATLIQSCDNGSIPEVLTIDHRTGRLVYRPVLATAERMENDLYTILTESGKKIRATGNHRIFVEGQGYRRVSQLVRGDSLLSLWDGKEAKEPDLSDVLRHDQDEYSIGAVCQLRPAFRAQGIYTGKTDSQGSNDILLFQSVQAGTSEVSRFSTLSYVRRASDKRPRSQVLQQEMYSTDRTNTFTPHLFGMSSGVSASITSNKVLQQSVFGQSPFHTNEREEQFSFVWNGLRQVVQGNASVDIGTRRAEMFSMSPQAKEEQGAQRVICSSHQSRLRRQPSGQLDHDVLSMSWDTPQVYSDPISSIERNGNQSIKVYDIQVEGTGNFFAGEILVHNCLIIDDPIRDAMYADSPNWREKMWEWYSCYHPDTEVLTEQGWKFIGQIEVGERLATTNPETRAIEYLPATDTMEYPFDGELVTLDQRLGASFAVTPNHQVFWTRYQDGSLQSSRADELPQTFYLPRTGKWEGKEIPTPVVFDGEHFNIKRYEFDPLDWYEFVGLFVTEGCAYENGMICITQIKPEGRIYVEQILTRLGVNWWKNSKTYSFRSKPISAYLRTLGTIAREKHLPEEIFQYSVEVGETLLLGLLAGDGQWVSETRARFTTTSKQLSDDVYRLAFQCGYKIAGSVQHPEPKVFPNGKVYSPRTAYTHSLRKSGLDGWVNQADHNTREPALGRMRYTGPVYCVTVPPYHNVVIRYKGRVSINGQSVAYTRLHPGAPVFVIACMTGDTPVRMSDGTERPLVDIQAGDEVATYEDGKLTTAQVLNHASMGKDAIFKVKMGNGKVVRANARHPFLVADGELKWVRVRDLRIGQFMVALDSTEFAGLRILSIEPDGYEIVYDVEVERTGNFIANGFVSHNTRWHHDDLTGRLLLQNHQEGADQWNEVFFPAIRTDTEGAEKALWPERYDITALNRIRASVGQRTWQSLYQGNPTPREGNSFKRWMFSKTVRAEPNDCKKYIRYWDKAGTSGGGDYTVGALLALDAEGRFFLVDIVRGQWAAYERERVIRATAEQDKARIGNRTRYEVWQEQEPGSGGLQSAQATQKSLAGFIVKNDVSSRRGSIESMADVLATQMEAGNFYMVGGQWMQQLIEEFLQYPYGVHDDQVVAVCGAFRGVSGHKSFRVDFI